GKSPLQCGIAVSPRLSPDSDQSGRADHSSASMAKVQDHAAVHSSPTGASLVKQYLLDKGKNAAPANHLIGRVISLAPRVGDAPVPPRYGPRRGGPGRLSARHEAHAEELRPELAGEEEGLVGGVVGDAVQDRLVAEAAALVGPEQPAGVDGGAHDAVARRDGDD